LLVIVVLGYICLAGAVGELYKKKYIMEFNFSFFGKQEVRRFSYKPRFYDPEAEERRKKYGDFTKPKAEGYVPGQHVKGSLRGGGYSQTKDMSRNQRLLGAVSLILLFAVIFLLWKYFPILLDSMQQEQARQEIVNDQELVEDAFQIVSVK